MSKIKVDAIETTSSNVKFSPKGTGLIKVQGTGSADGTLEIAENNANSIKIKASPNSAGQDHTIILPDNNALVDGHLHVKSITGSGSTATGQLEFKQFNTLDTSNIDASLFTTGTVPNANLPTPAATSGAALKLVSTQELTGSQQANYIEFSSLTAGTNYLFVAKKLKQGLTGYSPFIQMYDSSGTQFYYDYHEEWGYSSAYSYATSRSYRSNLSLSDQSRSGYWSTSNSTMHAVVMLELNTEAIHNYFFLKKAMTRANSSTLSRTAGSVHNNVQNAIDKVRFYSSTSTSTYWEAPTKILMYEYIK